MHTHTTATRHRQRTITPIIALILLSLNIAAQPPATPQLRTLSINPANGKVQLKWSKPNPADNILRHEISRKAYTSPNYYFETPPTASVNMPDTIYEELIPGIETQRQTYRIRAANPTDVSSITDAYLTMQFAGTYNPCANRIDLRWTEYKRLAINTATGQIDEANTEANTYNQAIQYQVWGHPGTQYDPAQAQALTTRSPQSQDITLPDPQMNYQLLTDTTYQLIVKAYMPGATDTATSHLLTISTQNRRLLQRFNIDSIISSQGLVNLYFDLDHNTQLDTFALYRSDIPFRPLKWYYRADEVTAYQDRDVAPGQVYNYSLVAFRCGKPALTSDTASNIRLYATPLGQKAQLIWTDAGYNSTYTLARNLTPTIIYTGDDSMYIDHTTADSLCYGPKTYTYTIESHRTTATGNHTYSRSEPSRITLEQIIVLPDAIDPKSTIQQSHSCHCTTDCTYQRSHFGPIMDLHPNSYQLTIEIFNRAGQRIFGRIKHFDDPLEKSFHYWDGRYNGAYVHAGAYAYSLRIEFQNRQPILLRGTVTVAYSR